MGFNDILGFLLPSLGIIGLIAKAVLRFNKIKEEEEKKEHKRPRSAVYRLSRSK